MTLWQAPAPVRTTALRRLCGDVSDRIAGIPLEMGFRKGWLLLFGAAASLMALGVIGASWLLYKGVGVWGINQPVAWGFAIINFVWWIGIGHAGTLISAILLLLRQTWRTSINRFAEAMTLFAVANAGIFPLLHLGRIWKFYYILPYPDTMGVWPQWRSPLVWDLFAVLTYFTVSFLFWYVGLLPDLATMRDKARRRWVARIAGFFALGWRGSARHWHDYVVLYMLLAGLATPLVVSVHTIVSLDFAVAIVPGWHTTIYPPFFVAGAIYSGFAMVLMLVIPVRRIFHLEDLVTTRHLDNMSKVMLTSGLIVAYGYLMETFTGWYSGEAPEYFEIVNRATGPYAPAFWGMILCNVLIGQTLWFRRVRTRPGILFVVATFVNVGMWLERFVIVVVSLHRDYMPSAWGMYVPTIWDWAVLLGSLGFFMVLMLLFIRLLPMISIYELREEAHYTESINIETLDDDLPAAEPAQPILDGVVPDDDLFGYAAEFEGPSQLAHAAAELHRAGYRHLDAHSPFPIPELSAALRLPKSRMAPIVLVGALTGALGAYFMQWYSAAVDYRLNVGGRPFNSWPSFIPLTFELAVLGGALFGVIGLLFLTGLPRPYHSVFNAPGFSRASTDSFFLCVAARDRLFDRAATREFLEELHPLQVSEVPA